MLTYCLMRNHFHLLVYQKDKSTLSLFMKSLMISYSRYFNLKYKRSGALFDGRYKASRISSDTYLTHISRYIHLNPRSWKRYPYSSIDYYRRGNEPEWLKTSKVLDMHEDREKYIEFVYDYEEYKRKLEEIKH